MHHNDLSAQTSALKATGSGLGGTLHINDLPVLQLGMVGFSPSQRVQIEGIVKLLPHKTAVWRVGRFSEAHAWLICGDKVRMAEGDIASTSENLMVLAGLPSEKSVTLNVSEINRPLAFSTPLPHAEIQPSLMFDAASPDSLLKLLGQFEKCLCSQLAQFVLGKQLIEREAELQPKVYHVQFRGTLLAVLDFVSFRPSMLADANPQHFQQAIWEKRPAEASDIPRHFVPTDVARLRWIYAQHSERDVLPARYRQKQIYFRRSPQVELSWVTDSQLRVLNELCSRPASFQQLVERLGMRHQILARDLSCLYFATSLTITASKAASIEGRRKNATDSSFASGSNRRPPHLFDSSMPHSGASADNHEPTAPVQLSAE